MNNINIMFYTAKDVSKILGISETSAYRIIKKLNNELLSKEYIVIPGKISKKYFESKVMM
ncbi:transcriptional regulator [Clostridium muellerianum]|nr:transcriptional regulator [Clostridium muellerianum]